jgi:CRISPR-associated protein Cas2
MQHEQRDVTCYVIAYDISNDRRRTKVHKVLSGFGQWTQFSVFECHLTAKQSVQLRDRLDKMLRIDEDRVCLYPLCKDCVGKVETVGGKKPKDPTVMVI